MAAHIESCESCSREFAGYEAMYEGLASLSDVEMVPPYGFHWRVMTSLGPVAVPDVEDHWDRVVPVAAAAALATAAAGTVVLVRAYRHRAA